MAEEMEGIEVLEEAVSNREPEVGTSGSMIVRGELFNNEDYVPELRGDQAMVKFEEMWYSDGQIEGALFHLRSPLVSGKWISKAPQSKTDEDGNKVSDDRDLEVADFIRQWTVDFDPLDDGSGWSGFVEHTISMAMVFGFMPYFKQWGTDREGFQVISKYAPRDPKSIKRFHLKEGGTIESMEQWSYGISGFGKTLIRGEKIIPFTFRKRGDNWFGRSILRHCYMPWSLWRQLAIIDAMRHERHGMGIPVLEVPPGAGKNANEQARKVVKELRAHERQYVKLPPGFKLTWYFPTGSGTDIIGSMKYWDEIKSRSLMNEMMSLGAQVSGSRNLGETKQKAALLAVQGVATWFSNVMRKYAIGPMVLRNFGDDAPIPNLELEDLDALDIVGLSQAMKNFREGDFIEPDDPLEEYVRSKMKVTAKQPSTSRKKPAPSANPFDAVEEDTKEFRFKPGKAFRLVKVHGQPIIITSAEPEKKSVPKAKTFRDLRRAPLEHEKACAFDEMVSWFNNEPARAFDEDLKPIRDEQMSEIAKAVAAADEKDLSRKNIKYAKLDKLSNAAFKVLKSSYMNGRKSIKEEMKRQESGEEPSRPDTTTDAPLVGGISDLLKPATGELARVRRLAESFSEEVTEGIVKRAAEVALRAKLLGLTQEAVEQRVTEALVSLSEAKVAQRLAGDVIASFTFGRNDALSRVESEIEATYYSAIMDDGTCGPCGDLDGQQHEYGDQDFATPNPNCAYPPHCRCVTIPVFKRD